MDDDATPTTASPETVTSKTVSPAKAGPVLVSSKAGSDKGRPKPVARKSIPQIMREDRQRTANWRAGRRARRVPEASQVDRAVLEALMWRSRRGSVMMLDKAAFVEAMRVAVRLLIWRRADPDEAVAAVQKRVGDHARSTAVRDLERREKFHRENPLPAGEKPMR